LPISIRRVAFFESPVIASPNRSRAGFDRIFRSTEHHTASRRSRFDFIQLLEDDRGLYLVAEEPGEKIVLGFIGRWVGPGLWTGHLDQDLLVTDVRVWRTNDDARRKFQRCGTLVRPFVTAMGRPVLRLVRKKPDR